MTTEILVRMQGINEKILNQLVRKGFYKTKSEVLRAGVLELGKEYNIIKTPAAYYREKVREAVRRKPLSSEYVLREIEKLEE